MIVNTQTNIGRKIVADESLVLYLDAANPDSYSGIGAIWYDLTNYQNHASLINNPTFDSGTGIPSSIYFNNQPPYNPLVQQKGSFSVNLFGSDFVTVEIWMNISTKTPNSGGSYATLFGWNNIYGIKWIAGNTLGYFTWDPDITGLVDSLGQINYLLNNWYNWSFVMKGSMSSPSFGDNKIYINGISQTLIPWDTQYQPFPNRFNFANGSGSIAGIINTDMAADMKCAIFKIYNRELTQSEITQNFNAMKNRFGIF